MRSARRVLSTALTLVILLPSAAFAASEFGDVESGIWYEAPVAWLVENDITTGVERGCFAPLDVVTRGQVAVFLFRLDEALGGSPSGTGHPFSDVNAPWQQPAIAWMYEHGITTGTSAVTFSPDEPVTRGQFAALLWRYAGRPNPAGAHPFLDVVAPWQQAAIAWMYELDITTGTSERRFSPDYVMARAEAATFMWRFVGEPEPDASGGGDMPCSRELRLALTTAGLTQLEATCSIDYLSDFTVEELTAVLSGEAYPSMGMIVAISAAADECLTPDRVDELTRLFF